MRTLDLGCGTAVRGHADWEPWGIDLVPGDAPNVRQADLTADPIPFPDDHFNRIYAYDFLEHLPMRAYVGAQDGRIRTINVMINLFNEVARVLGGGGIFETFTPHLPHWPEVYRDPTHVSVWTEQTWDYFARPGQMVPLTRHYGLRADFEIIRKEWRGAHLYVELINHKR
jgi:SAM-dependent methyltransferase